MARLHALLALLATLLAGVLLLLVSAAGSVATGPASASASCIVCWMEPGH